MKIKTISDFFKEPVNKELEDEVNAQVAIIDYSVAFGRYLCMNYIPIYQDTWTDDNGTNYTTSQLLHKFTNEYEHRRLA